MAVPSSIAAFIAQKASVVAVTAVIGTGAAAGAVAVVAQDEEPSSVRIDATTSIDDDIDDDIAETTDWESHTEVETGIEAIEPDGDDGGTEPVTCDGARNHGEYVSSRARKSDAERADRSMRDVARTDCGKPDTGAPGRPDQQVGDIPDDDGMSNDDGAKPGHGRSRGQAAEGRRQDG
jgi:hypothetical protein